jgi:hypothetical protein
LTIIHQISNKVTFIVLFCYAFCCIHDAIYITEFLLIYKHVVHVHIMYLYWRWFHLQKLASLQLEIEVILKSGLLLEDDSHFLESLALPIDFISDKPLW